MSAPLAYPWNVWLMHPVELAGATSFLLGQSLSDNPYVAAIRIAQGGRAKMNSALWANANQWRKGWSGACAFRKKVEGALEVKCRATSPYPRVSDLDL